jgi:hypothetical protein
LFALAQAYIDAFNRARDPNCDDDHLHCFTNCELANDCATRISCGASVLKEAIDILFHGGPFASDDVIEGNGFDFASNFDGHECTVSDEGCEYYCRAAGH